MNLAMRTMQYVDSKESLERVKDDLKRKSPQESPRVGLGNVLSLSLLSFHASSTATATKRLRVFVTLLLARSS